MKIKPVGKRVLIEPIQGDTMSEGGLVLADTNNAQTPVKGKVVEIGEDSKFKIGDVVLFRRYSVDELKGNLGGREYKHFFCDDEDIIAVELPE